MSYENVKIFDYFGNGLELIYLFKDEPNVFVLDSSAQEIERGRYTFIGFDPFHFFKSNDKDALKNLRIQFDEYRRDQHKKAIPLTSGIVGFLSYDYGVQQLEITRSNDVQTNQPHCLFGFYDIILVIDHFDRKLILHSSGLPEKEELLRRKRANERLQSVVKKLQILDDPSFLAAIGPQPKPKDSLALDLISNFSKEEYCATVKKSLNHISEGDIYQVNLSQRFELDVSSFDIDPVDIYSILRDTSPSQFSAYMDCDDFQIISSSPERFIHLDNRIIQTRPMKGTRPRGWDASNDKRIKEEFILSRKDQAELLMIIDLERNDLGRVCEYGSVHVKEMRAIEEYVTVFQATSTIEGVLKQGLDGFDVLKNCFPSGSITGCPKTRAMEIIEYLEPNRRGIYTGSLGYMDFNGNMDFNILIRTMISSKDNIVFNVGGGIVSDSTAENEYDETMVKARALVQTLQRTVSTQKTSNV